MYKVNLHQKTLTKLVQKSYSELGLRERFDIQEWVESNPSILGGDLMVIAKEYELPSRCRLDLLAVDRKANLVIIELKRDDSGASVDWQAIKYASYCSAFSNEDIFRIYAEYLKLDDDAAKEKIEAFIDEDLETLNERQRVILASRSFHSDVVSSVLWLLDYGIDIQCVKLEPYLDEDGDLFIYPNVIIPAPEAKDYIKRKETKIKEKSLAMHSSSFSLEKGTFAHEELESRLLETLTRPSDLTPRLTCFLKILLETPLPLKISRETLKVRLTEEGVGHDQGHSGRLLSNISQFISKKGNSHLRQVVEFDSDGVNGSMKDNYFIPEQYRETIKKVLDLI